MREHYALRSEELDDYFDEKYGTGSEVGWSPSIRRRHSYFLPGEIYEMLMNRLVKADTTWVDVGGGSAVFPGNASLSSKLASRCERLVAVDPSENVMENEYADATANCMFENFETAERFDLATFRMVVEHVTHPAGVVRKLGEIMKTGGLVVVYTVNKRSPVPLVARVVPFKLHFALQSVVWGGQEKNTFPVHYRMNTRSTLKRLFEEGGFKEEHFQYLDDLSVTIKFKQAHRVENAARSFLSRLGLRYPENNLLGVYKKA